MNTPKIDRLFREWREGKLDAWSRLKPHVARSLRAARPTLLLAPEHMTAVRNLLCLRLEMAREEELRQLPGTSYWEFYAALIRLFIVELLRDGISESVVGTQPHSPT